MQRYDQAHNVLGQRGKICLNPSIIVVTYYVIIALRCYVTLRERRKK